MIPQLAVLFIRPFQNLQKDYKRKLSVVKAILFATMIPLAPDGALHHQYSYPNLARNKYSKFSAKNEIFPKNPKFFAKNRNFCQKPKFSPKNEIFAKGPKFSKETKFSRKFSKNPNFRKKTKFSPKTEIFAKIFQKPKFSQKKPNFHQKPKFSQKNWNWKRGFGSKWGYQN